MIVRLELIQNLKNFSASTGTLASSTARKFLFKPDYLLAEGKSLENEQDKKEVIIQDQT